MFKINRMLKVNIVMQLLIFFVMAISINFLQLNLLIGILALLLIWLAITKNDRFLYAIMRFKWFLLIMMFIFALSTPGEHIVQWPFSANSNFISPTYEGLMAGATQVLRILLMLAALSIILASNTRQQLISGFYLILYPLQYLGLKVERFAARLWLTLHYVEKQRGTQNGTNNKHNIVEQLKNMTLLAPNQTDEQVSVELTAPNFSWFDFIVMALLLVVIYAIWAFA